MSHPELSLARSRKPRRFPRPWQLIVAELAAGPVCNAVHRKLLTQPVPVCSCPLCRRDDRAI